MGSRSKKRHPDLIAQNRSYPCFPCEDALSGESFSTVPPVDIYETEDHFILNAEVPGVADEDIHVEVSGSELTLRGERRQDATCSDENYHRLEGMRGEFRRTFSLRELLDADRIRASLKDGVLSLVIPKSSKPRKATIHQTIAGR